ncbi:MAG: hypothetical protein ACYCVB_17850 [Bacilli bacterium]
MLRKLGDFGFGVVYSGKLKVKKWLGIVQRPSERQVWQSRLMRSGHAYREELTGKLRERIMGSNLEDKEMSTLPNRIAAPVQKGSRVKFYALDQQKELDGIVVITNIESSGQFFLVHTQGEDAKIPYLCIDCGDKIIGDTQLGSFI